MTSLLDSLKIRRGAIFRKPTCMCLMVRLNNKRPKVFYYSRYVQCFHFTRKPHDFVFLKLRAEETCKAKFPVAHFVHLCTYLVLADRPLRSNVGQMASVG